MTGGHATAGGMEFEAQVAAWLAVHLLAEVQLDQLGDHLAKLIDVQLEADSPVDDIVARTRDGGFLFVNVKTSADLSDRSGSVLESVFDQFVRQWLAGASRSRGSAKRQINPATDCLLLAVQLQKSGTVIRGAAVLKRIRELATVKGAAATDIEQRFLAAAEQHIRNRWVAQSGSAPSDDEVLNLLRAVRVTGLQFDGGDRAKAVALLRDSVLDRGTDSDAAWNTLVAECLKFATGRSGGGLTTFRELLRKAGFKLRAVPEFAADIETLQRVTDDTLGMLKLFARLPATPRCRGNEDLAINRACSTVIVDHAKTGSLVAIGEAGAGKSGALYDGARALIADGHPVVVLAVDRHPVGTMAALSKDLGLTNDLIDVLNAWPADKPGVLLIDALDASRGGPSERVFQELISAILEKAPSWRVVASIREFDLRFGERFRGLFRGSPPDPAFTSELFSNVRHVYVRQFGEEEIGQVKEWSPELKHVIETANSKLDELLRSPFNLFLLATIVSSGNGASDLNNIRTQIELLDRYWSNRLGGADRRQFDRERVVGVLTERMVQERTLSAWVADVPSGSGEYLDQILSAGVLVPRRMRTHDDVSQVAFAHHRLFDYAIARLSLKGGQDSTLAQRLTDEDRTLLLAPGVMLALQMLWESEDSRRDFWQQAIAITKANEHGFARTLPARVAAELNERQQEFRPLIDRIADGHQDREVALVLLRHVFGVLLADIVPKSRIIGPQAVDWCAIARDIADASVSATVYPLRAVLGRWIEKPELLTAEQKQALNAAARRLLVHLSTSDRYDEGAIVSCIQCISRTIEVALGPSTDALMTLLTPERARLFGHRELRWLAQEAKSLMKGAPEVLGQLYKVTFGTELPSAKETTQLGDSRILTLTSNKRQDFELAQYTLNQQVSEFIVISPQSALPALVDAIERFIILEHSPEKGALPLSWHGRATEFLPDRSYLWWRSSKGDQESLLDGLVDGLVRVAKEKGAVAFREAVDLVAVRNRMAAVWAALLRAGLQAPDVAAPLATLLTSRTILTAAETRKPAGDLISSLHGRLDRDTRLAIENAVLQLPVDQYRDRDILLARFDPQALISAVAVNELNKLKQSGPLPENRAPFEITSGWRARDPNKYFEEAGIDVTEQGNAELLALTRQVEALKPPEGDEPVVLLARQWPVVLRLHEKLVASPEIPERIRMSGWDALASIALTVSDAAKEPTALAQFPKIEEMIEGAVAQSEPIAESAEEDFARFPSWGRPSPRIMGAEALVAFARASNNVSDKHAQLIRSLATDRAPAVRHQVLARINGLYNASPDLMWGLCEQTFQREQNRGVLQFFLSAFGNVMGARPDWAAAQLLALGKRISLEQEGGDDWGEVLVPLVVNLWFWHDRTEMGELLDAWCSDPIEHKEAALKTLLALRGAIVLGDPASPTPRHETIRARAIRLFDAVITACVEVFEKLLQTANPGPEVKAQGETALRVLDVAAKEIYFGSGAYAASERSNKSVDTVVTDSPTRVRFLREMGAPLEKLSLVRYPAVTHHLLETLAAFVDADHVLVFRLVIRALLQGGQGGGYQFESLGADLLIKLVQRYLADYKPWLAEDVEARTNLIRVLDAFAEVGWPDARRLVYELPEMLR